MTETTVRADLWFDPICPWAWQTSRWLLEAAEVREIDLRFHLMSLAVLNEGHQLPEKYEVMMREGWYLSRVVAAAARDHGEKIVEPLYTEMGTRIHPGGNEDYREVTGLALEAAGLPSELAGAGTDTTLDATIRASHDEAIAAVGPDLGTPVVRIDGSACFGPVLAQVPRGEAAGRVFDGVRALTGFEYFFELKRTRTAEPVFG
ncbi:DSBA oxidoreductase [Amycolatopsis sp. MJM2582]|uniref:mycothiol-dependent nitroreductase Rv2466c family protein n=1 Tax=Amycolatopsis TaxID=1813 RepID=UPI000507357D|nr:DSBA oxidoreductase [Amycolatopsis sp. MJM2582]KFZ76605.1 DSBA oxidoreductase [Amycolatopsis sp. MJM2582]